MTSRVINGGLDILPLLVCCGVGGTFSCAVKACRNPGIARILSMLTEEEEEDGWWSC
jgi:hypothetical protein